MFPSIRGGHKDAPRFASLAYNRYTLLKQKAGLNDDFNKWELTTERNNMATDGMMLKELPPLSYDSTATASNEWADATDGASDSDQALN